MTRRPRRILLGLAGAAAGLAMLWFLIPFGQGPRRATPFDGKRAYQDVRTQVGFGPRTPGSEGHTRIREWLQTELETAGWTVDPQESTLMGHPIINLLATRGTDPPEILLGAHYDTRLLADEDPEPARRSLPVPGANDGASGVAVLLELARTLPEAGPPIGLAFFDAEDNGRIEGWDWILGSRMFLVQNPRPLHAVVIVDMVGDADLQLYYEINSDKTLREQIWKTAADLGYQEAFRPEEKFSMLDDHTPFLEAGIPAVDLIDFDYPHWHTTQDTPDKVSPRSLQIVGDTLWRWLASQAETGHGANPG